MNIALLHHYTLSIPELMRLRHSQLFCRDAVSLHLDNFYSLCFTWLTVSIFYADVCPSDQKLTSTGRIEYVLKVFRTFSVTIKAERYEDTDC